MRNLQLAGGSGTAHNDRAGEHNERLEPLLRPLPRRAIWKLGSMLDLTDAGAASHQAKRNICLRGHPCKRVSIHLCKMLVVLSFGRARPCTVPIVRATRKT